MLRTSATAGAAATEENRYISIIFENLEELRAFLTGWDGGDSWSSVGGHCGGSSVRGDSWSGIGGDSGGGIGGVDGWVDDFGLRFVRYSGR